VLLGFSVFILVGVLAAAIYVAVRYRSMLTGMLVGLMALIVLQAAVLQLQVTGMAEVPAWLVWVARGEIGVVLSAALALLTIAVMLGALEKNRASQQTLLEQTAALEHAQRVAGLGYYIYDDDVPGMVYCSDEFAAIHGMPANDLLQAWQDSLDFVHPDDRERVRAEFDEAERMQRAYSVDYRLVRRDGEIRLVREMGDYDIGRKAGNNRSVGAMIDLTDIRRREIELQENRAALRLAQSHAGFGHYVLNSEMRRLNYISRSLYEMLGLDEQHLEGEDSSFFVDMIVKEDRARVVDV